MALEIGAGITIGGGITLQIESGGGGGAANVFTVGDGKTVSISTFSGAADHLEIVTIGQQTILQNPWTSTALSGGTGGSGTVTLDLYNGEIDNGNGTYTYDWYIFGSPGPYSWNSATITV